MSLMDQRGVGALLHAETDAIEQLPSVVFVVTQSGNDANGGVESITEVVERLTRVKPSVVTQMESPASRRWRDSGSEVLIWPMASVRMRSLLRANMRMYKLVRSTGCAVVHCNDILALWHTSFGARAAGASVVFNVRNIKPRGHRYGWRWRLARRISNRQLVLSKEMRTALERRLGTKNSNSGSATTREIEYIYSAVDPSRLSPVEPGEREALRSRLGIGAREFAVGVVGAFEPRKAQLDFIQQGLTRLSKSLPQSRVFFIGDFVPEENEYARKCLEGVQDFGLTEFVRFAGYSSEVADWYRALDLVIVVSRNEGLARCMIESLACATPVVSFDVCSAREILEEGECGVVVPMCDYELLVERITEMAATPDVRERLGANGVALAKEMFDPREVVDRYEQFYLSLIGN